MTDPTNEPDWLTALRDVLEHDPGLLDTPKGHQCITLLLDNRDHHEELRRQAEAVCERRVKRLRAALDASNRTNKRTVGLLGKVRSAHEEEPPIACRRCGEIDEIGRVFIDSSEHDDLGFGAALGDRPPPGPGECPECYAIPGVREQDCGATACPHAECLHNHHDGCPACLDDPEVTELERRTAEREDARHGMKIARADRDAAQLEVKRLLAKVSELEATLAATLGSWAAYAKSVPGNAEWLTWSESGMVGPVPGAGTPEDSEPGGEP